MTRIWWTLALERLEKKQASILVTVCTVKGSAPREPGAKMLVWEEGFAGTVGGGSLEFVVLEQARKMLQSSSRWRFQNYPLGPLLAQCCGGHVGLLLERIDENNSGWLKEVAEAEGSLSPYCLTSDLGISDIQKQVINEAGAPGNKIEIGMLDGEEKGETPLRIGQGATIKERICPQAQLFIFGAGHVGQAVKYIVQTLPVCWHWFDTRPEYEPLGAQLGENLSELISSAPVGSFFLVFTHSHELDYTITRAVLSDRKFRYCGLIGSATKRARFEKRLRADGVDQNTLKRLVCPIGALGIRSKIPQAMAVAIAAELLLVMQGAATQTNCEARNYA